MKKTKVLFICTGNSARSQLAEALLRWHAGDHFDVFSAGLEPKTMNPMTTMVLDEWGIDSSNQYSKSINEYLGKKEFDFVITVCDSADQNCPIFPGTGVRLHWSFEDPSSVPENLRLEKFQQIRDAIDCQLLDWLSEEGVQAQR